MTVFMSENFLPVNLSGSVSPTYGAGSYPSRGGAVYPPQEYGESTGGIGESYQSSSYGIPYRIFAADNRAQTALAMLLDRYMEAVDLASSQTEMDAAMVKFLPVHISRLVRQRFGLSRLSDAEGLRTMARREAKVAVTEDIVSHSHLITVRSTIREDTVREQVVLSSGDGAYHTTISSVDGTERVILAATYYTYGDVARYSVEDRTNSWGKVAPETILVDIMTKTTFNLNISEEVLAGISFVLAARPQDEIQLTSLLTGSPVQMRNLLWFTHQYGRDNAYSSPIPRFQVEIIAPVHELRRVQVGDDPIIEVEAPGPKFWTVYFNDLAFQQGVLTAAQWLGQPEEGIYWRNLKRNL